MAAPTLTFDSISQSPNTGSSHHYHTPKSDATAIHVMCLIAGYQTGSLILPTSTAGWTQGFLTPGPMAGTWAGLYYSFGNTSTTPIEIRRNLVCWIVTHYWLVHGAIFEWWNGNYWRYHATGATALTQSWSGSSTLESNEVSLGVCGTRYNSRAPVDSFSATGCTGQQAAQGWYQDVSLVSYGHVGNGGTPTWTVDWKGSATGGVITLVQKFRSGFPHERDGVPGGDIAEVDGAPVADIGEIDGVTALTRQQESGLYVSNDPKYMKKAA